MSTRAVITFVDKDGGTFHVYQHLDGYPSGVSDNLLRAVESSLTWELPRFEADEFGAGFIAVNKKYAGGFRLTNDWKDHGDLEYRYVFDGLNVKAFEVSSEGDGAISTRIFKGALSKFAAWAKDRG
jgi:hypothetical protein